MTNATVLRGTVKSTCDYSDGMTQVLLALTDGEPPGSTLPLNFYCQTDLAARAGYAPGAKVTVAISTEGDEQS